MTEAERFSVMDLPDDVWQIIEACKEEPLKSLLFTEERQVAELFWAHCYERGFPRDAVKYLVDVEVDGRVFFLKMACRHFHSKAEAVAMASGPVAVGRPALPYWQAQSGYWSVLIPNQTYLWLWLGGEKVVSGDMADVIELWRKVGAGVELGERFNEIAEAPVVTRQEFIRLFRPDVDPLLAFGPQRLKAAIQNVLDGGTGRLRRDGYVAP